ncbi:hypothetical protein CONPUDRAFT_139379 [Coniophora puteana RWD-64-598 SS2]|uniref:Casein kinase substrate phosphoprotein PP28 domain-containing protein n=1 Tax=Coniophora puteana (strain RWD-64-598) TaxID=741705 RepID=A0A5M3MCJ5_CONPW|nr:uncharacterized protein CONPUDRAFT_139379 [Coniophora puteana RWD-64-598 SS2]EIW76624.1 hypothetical protein CONPUDRAFT_139379 [Coniophora puteana RWD-64-598 SS2]
MVRGSGKFKAKRGGGRSFSKNLVLDENGVASSTDRRRPRRGEEVEDDDKSDEDEEDEEDEEEEEEEDEEEGEGGEDKPELTRAERRELKKKQAAAKQTGKAPKKADGSGGDEDDEDLINPNHVQKKLNISDIGSQPMSRREREAKEKQEAKERYWKLHLQGKTDEAKSDMARLKKIREEREAAQAKRKAELDAKSAETEAKKQQQLNRKAK